MLDAYYIGGATLQEVGKSYGVTSERVRQRLQKGLRELRKLLVPRSDPAFPTFYAPINGMVLLESCRRRGVLDGKCVTEHPSDKAYREWCKAQEKESSKEREKFNRSMLRRIRENWNRHRDGEDKISPFVKDEEDEPNGPSSHLVRYVPSRVLLKTIPRNRYIFHRVVRGILRAGFTKTEVGEYQKNGLFIQTCAHQTDETQFFIVVSK